VIVYSVCLYVLLNGSAFFTIGRHYLLSFNREGDLNDSIFTFMMIISLANCTFVPALAWLDTPKAIHYFKKWEQFQVRGASYFLNSRNKIGVPIFLGPLLKFSDENLMTYTCVCVCWHAVSIVIKAIRYKPEGRGFETP
jgi:hypothetical protein